MNKVIVLCILIFTWFRTAQAQTSLDTAVNFTVKDVNGVTHQLYDYLEDGKIVLIDFFTVTCGPCATYAPEISASYQHFGCNSGNVVVLGINWGSDNAQVIDFGQTNGAEYPEISGTEGNGNHVVSDFGILSYPSVILIKPDKSIPEPYIWPPSTTHLDSVLMQYGGMENSCLTGLPGSKTGNHGIQITPNPARLICQLSWKEDFTINKIELINLQGKKVQGFFQPEPDNITRNQAIDLSGIHPGFYLIQLITNQQIRITKPLIVY